MPLEYWKISIVKQEKRNFWSPMKLMYVNLKCNLMKDAEKDLQKKELITLLEFNQLTFWNNFIFVLYNIPEEYTIKKIVIIEKS